MSLGPTAHADATVTFLFSFLSLFGSVLVLLSYLVARSKSTPRIANLILHLAASDFFWFLSAGIQSSYWLFSDDQMVPRNACFVLSPLMIFTRMASLAWTCVISFNVLMSVEKRKWLWQGGDQSWMEYHKRYYVAIFLLAAPGTILTLVKQHSSPGSSNLGCSAGYEALGVWYEVFFPEVLPILMGFLCNVYVFAKVYGKLSKSAYPQSVRKRRKRIMYHYIIVCIVCWVPTVATYMIELIGYHSPIAEILARACLYSSGFLNFLVFGMQDPHLKRSFKLMIYYSGVTSVCMLILPSSSYYYYFQGWRPLKATDVEKNVMFQEETILSNADLSKDKRSVYRNRKLSKADRMDLYAERPDLDLRTPAEPSAPGAAPVPAKSAMKGSRAAAAVTTAGAGGVGTADELLADHSGTDSGSEGGDGKRRSSSRRPRGEKKVRSRESAETPASREERAASLFHSHVDAGTLIVNSVVPAGGNEVTGRPSITNSRSRSSSFHSGVSDGKYDLLAPLLGADAKEQVSSSYPQPTSSATIWEQDERMREAKASAKKGFTLIPEFLSGGSASARSKSSSQAQQQGTVNPMDVVSAGFRSSSTERLVIHNPANAPHDIEEGIASSERELLVRNAEEKVREMRRQQVALDRRALEDSGSCDNDEDLSSSDDESDEEDKELSIPISAL